MLFCSIGFMSAQQKITTIKNPKYTLKTNTLKLPVLRATSKAKFNEKALETVKNYVRSTTTTTAAPRPNATSTSALNVTLTPSRPVAYRKGGLVFTGTFYAGTVYTRRGMIGARFKAKRNKTYRVKVDYLINYKEDKCSQPMMFFTVGDNTQALSIKKGRNISEFLVQSDVEETIFLRLLSKNYLRCNGTAYRDIASIRLRSIKITELQN